MFKKVGQWWFYKGGFMFLNFMRDKENYKEKKHVKKELEHEII